MTRIALIGVAGALLLGGATFAMAQNGPPTGTATIITTTAINGTVARGSRDHGGGKRGCAAD